jgi:hypothetical protein
MIGEIFYTLFSTAAFFAVFYLLMLSLMKDWEKKKLDKSCPHCKDYTRKGWKSFLTPARQ